MGEMARIVDHVMWGPVRNRYYVLRCPHAPGRYLKRRFEPVST